MNVPRDQRRARQSRGARSDAGRRRRCDVPCSCSATWSATAPTRTRWSTRSRAAGEHDRASATTTRWGPGSRTSRGFNYLARQRHFLDRNGRPSPTTNRAWLAAAAAGAGARRRPRRDLPRMRPFDEDELHLRRPGRDARRMRGGARRCACSATRTCRRHSGWQGDDAGQITGRTARRRIRIPLVPDAQLPGELGACGQPRDGDPQCGVPAW
jgi:hypothetical protein